MLRLTRKQVREVDRICIDELGIPGTVLMEHAAIALLDGCRHLAVNGDLASTRFVIICGGGNNGGDGYALARLLHNAGAKPEIFSVKPIEELDGDARINASICMKMGITNRPADPEKIKAIATDVIVDAVFGTGLSCPPREDGASLIEAINRVQARRLAVDLPSGLDCDTGQPLGDAASCVRADLTVTFVAEKVGFPHGGAYLGKVIVGDIGAPREVIDRVASHP